MAWLSENLGTIAVSVMLAVVCILILRKMKKDKKEGKSPTCGGSCGGCAMSGMCHSKQNEEKSTKNENT